MRSALVAVVFVCGFLLGRTQSRSTVLLPYPDEAEHSNPQESLPNQARELEWQATEQYEYENSQSPSEERNQEPVEGNTDVPWEIIVQRLGKLRVRRQSNAEREGGRAFSRSGSVGGGGDRPMLSILNPLDVLRQRLLLEMARRRSINQINENKQLMQNVGRRRRDASIEKNRPKFDTPLNKRENGSTYRSGTAINTVRSSPGLQVNPSVQPPVEQ